MGSPSRRGRRAGCRGASLRASRLALAQEKGSLNLLCSVELEWCALMSTTFEKETRHQGQHGAQEQRRGAAPS
jgi:hypothetical protein